MQRVSVFSDDFDWYESTTQTDLAVASPDWAKNSSTNSEINVQSQSIRPTGTGGARRMYQVAGYTFAADQYASLDIVDYSRSNTEAGVIVRAQASGEANNCYAATVKGNGSQFSIAKFVAGVYTELINVSIPTQELPHTVSLEVIGNELIGYLDGSLIATVEDSTFSGGLPGISMYQSSTTILVRGDNFDSGNVIFVTGASITGASNITNETQPATITLANNENAPTAVQINGQAGSNIAFVSEDTEAGTETYSYLPPLIADDAEAELSVTVDGDTLTTTISYANSYDRDQLTHPATEAEYSTNSLSYPNAYGTSLAYEWKVVADASAAVVVIDWDALEADDGFFKDIAGYATPVANGSTTVTLGVFVPETGEAYQFDRTINVSDGGVVVEGQGLWRELFRDPTEELFTELFR